MMDGLVDLKNTHKTTDASLGASALLNSWRWTSCVPETQPVSYLGAPPQAFVILTSLYVFEIVLIYIYIYGTTMKHQCINRGLVATLSFLALEESRDWGIQNFKELWGILLELYFM